MYFYTYGLLNTSLVPNKEMFGDLDCVVSQKRFWLLYFAKTMC